MHPFQSATQKFSECQCVKKKEVEVMKNEIGTENANGKPKESFSVTFLIIFKNLEAKQSVGCGGIVLRRLSLSSRHATYRHQSRILKKGQVLWCKREG